jgi:cell wall-associated NlpC family hydrolase
VRATLVTIAVAVSIPAATAASDATSLALVRVPVANIWAAPNAGHLPLDPHAWPTAAVTYPQRLALVERMRGQVLFGETVRVLARRGSWTKIAVPDQESPFDPPRRPGWVHSWQLSYRLLPKQPGTVMVTARTARLSNGTELSFGTRLLLDGKLGSADRVLTPIGVSWIPAGAVRPLPRTRNDLVRAAKLFLGVHYLWGGLSVWGYDCSGIIWAVYRAHGIAIPRIAAAQFAAGRPVSLEDARPGDLLFYGATSVHHVAMYLGHQRMLESPDSAGAVRIVAMRSRGFAGARSFLR